MLNFSLFDSSQADPQMCGDVLRELTAQTGDVRHRALVKFAPKLRAAGDIHQFGLYDDAIAIAKKAACEHGLNFEIATDVTNVRLWLAVARDRTPSHHFESAKLGKVVDDLLGDAVTKVLRSRIVVRINEGKDGERVIRGARTDAQNAGDREQGKNQRGDEQRKAMGTDVMPERLGNDDLRDALLAVGADRLGGQEQAIAALVNGFNDARLARVVLKRFSKDGDTAGQNVVGHEDVGPDGRDQLFLVDDTRVLGKVDKHLHGFGFDTSAVSILGDEVDGRTDEPLAEFEISLHGKNSSDIILAEVPVALITWTRNR